MPRVQQMVLGVTALVCIIALLSLIIKSSPENETVVAVSDVRYKKDLNLASTREVITGSTTKQQVCFFIVNSSLC